MPAAVQALASRWDRITSAGSTTFISYSCGCSAHLCARLGQLRKGSHVYQYVVAIEGGQLHAAHLLCLQDHRKAAKHHEASIKPRICLALAGALHRIIHQAHASEPLLNSHRQGGRAQHSVLCSSLFVGSMAALTWPQVSEQVAAGHLEAARPAGQPEWPWLGSASAAVSTDTVQRVTTASCHSELVLAVRLACSIEQLEGLCASHLQAVVETGVDITQHATVRVSRSQQRTPTSTTTLQLL
jgi:hypothetical protein